MKLFVFAPAWSKSRLPIPKSPCKNGNSSHCPAVILNTMGINASVPAEDVEQSTDPLEVEGHFIFPRRRCPEERQTGDSSSSSVPLLPPLAEPEGLTQNPREPKRDAGRWANFQKDPPPRCAKPLQGKKPLTLSWLGRHWFSSSFQSY